MKLYGIQNVCISRYLSHYIRKSTVYKFPWLVLNMIFTVWTKGTTLNIGHGVQTANPCTNTATVLLETHTDITSPYSSVPLFTWSQGSLAYNRMWTDNPHHCKVSFNQHNSVIQHFLNHGLVKQYQWIQLLLPRLNKFPFNTECEESHYGVLNALFS